MSNTNHIAQKLSEVWYFRYEPALICNFVIYIVGLVSHVRIRRDERIRITPEWLEREAAEDLAALRFIASSTTIFRKLRVSPPKSTFRFSWVMASSLAELDRNGQLIPDQPPVPRRRKGTAAPAPNGKTSDPESAPGSPGSTVIVPAFLFHEGTHGSAGPLTVSVGENTDPDHKVEETP